MPRSTTISHLSRAWIDGRRRRGEISRITAADYRPRLDHLAKHLGDRPVANINRHHIDAWREELAKLAPASQRSYWSTAKQWFEWCVFEGHVDRSPMGGMPAPKEPRSVPRWIDAADVDAVMRATDSRGRLIIVLMAQLGVRRGEVARMRLEDFDLSNRLVLVRGKGGHERVLPLPEQVVKFVRHYAAEEGLRGGFLIRNRTSPELGVQPRTVGEIVTRAMRDGGIKVGPWDRKSAHSLRHTATADMLRHGAHVRDVQAILGHASLATTQRYMPLVVGTLSSAIDGRHYGHQN